MIFKHRNITPKRVIQHQNMTIYKVFPESHHEILMTHFSEPNSFLKKTPKYETEKSFFLISQIGSVSK